MIRAAVRLESPAWHWLVALVAVALACACTREAGPSTIGDPKRGQNLLHDYGCAACHVIPGVRGATGVVGPPLAHIGKRVYIAGMLPNTPENLARWIRAPQTFRPGTAMPDLHVSEQDVRDMVAALGREE